MEGGDQVGRVTCPRPLWVYWTFIILV